MDERGGAGKVLRRTRPPQRTGLALRWGIVEVEPSQPGDSERVRTQKEPEGNAIRKSGPES